MSQVIEQAVKSKYGAVATSGLSTDHSGVRAVAEAFGYSPEELASIPVAGQHGPVVRQSHGNRQPAARRSRGGPRLRRRPGRVPGSGQGRADRQGHRHRHDHRDAGPCSQECRQGTQWPADYERRIPSGDHRQTAAAGRIGGLRDKQLRHQSGPQQTRCLSRNRQGAEAGWTIGGQRHCSEEAAACRDRARPDGLRRLHRRGHPRSKTTAGN